MSVSDKNQAEALMGAYASAYSNQDLNSLERLLVEDGSIDIWGTGIDEHLTTLSEFRTQIQRDFGEAK